MSLRKKTLFMTGGLILLLVLCLSVISSIILTNNFREAEERVARRNAERMLNIINDDISVLYGIANNWAAWDDTYDFVLDGNDTYAKSNLTDENFTELKLNLIIITDNSGQVIFGKGYDLRSNTGTPVPDSLRGHLTAGDLLLGNTTPDGSVKGFFVAAEGPLLIAAYPIVKTDYSGPSRGMLIMGRFLNSKEIEHLSSKLNLAIEIRTLDNKQLPTDFQAAVSSLSKEKYYVHTLNAGAMASYTIINDIYGQPGVVARVETPRDFSILVRSGIIYFAFSFLLVGLIFCAINLLLLEKTVLSRLINLISAIKKVGIANDFSLRVPVSGKDELANLAVEINETLSSLERYHLMLQLTEEKNRNDLEKLVNDRTKELQSANIQLQAERKRFYYLLENLPAFVCLIAPDHSIVFANRYFRERFGDPEGKNCYQLFYHRKAPCKNCLPFKAIEKNKPGEWEWSSIDGKTYQIYYYPFYDVDGSLLALELGIDITLSKQLEKELARLDKLNLVGEMAAGIGHEIRNPMTTVRGFLQLLGEKQECVKYQEHFALMIEELDRANAIITEFLTLARDKSVALKPQNLNKVINAIYPLISADATVGEKNVTVEQHSIPDILIDEKEIRQLILNLVRNGLEAMSAGGNLTIGTLADGDEVILTVADQGKGIKPEFLKKIGTPFFTTKDNGTGLGLAICYSIAARHNAAIDVKTGPSGTTFYVRFKVNFVHQDYPEPH